MRLEDAVRIALDRTQRDGIRGWGLHLRHTNLDSLGELVQVGPVEGCMSDTCGHMSHSPAAPTLKWVPKQGTLHRLGADGMKEYFVLRLPERDVFLRLRKSDYYHEVLEIVDAEKVPEYLLCDFILPPPFPPPK